MKLNKAIKLCKEVAKNSTMRYKIGSIIFDNHNGNYVLGYNRSFGVKDKNRNKPFSLHSEEMSILKAIRRDFNFENSTMVIIRINKTDKKCGCKPCKNCRRLIEKVGIKTIYYVE